jgi:hypothetical protein
LLKRSLAHCEEQVAARLLNWVDPSDKSKGCIAVMRFDRLPSSREEFPDGKPTDITAWNIRQSGFYGPLVMQLDTPRGRVGAAG